MYKSSESRAKLRPCVRGFQKTLKRFHRSVQPFHTFLEVGSFHL
nr:MAG TPA: hypothetical protein [Caudoviricetes sp.]DAP82777.1 MAG TPA: hypothetical protein [Caudoviricetes sp.]